MHQHSRQRMAADNQFLKLQTRALSRSRTTADMESVIQQRVENTARLRELRLAREAQDKALALAAPAVKKKRAKPTR